jgi:NADPH:quinone reductase-like Zn-dependent oxidoreductase
MKAIVRDQHGAPDVLRLEEIDRPTVGASDVLVVLKERFEAGSLAPVVDRTFPLVETARALRYMGTGHARGKVVICV